jgi:hypothetical protein
MRVPVLRAEKNKPHTSDATDRTAATMPVARVRYHHQELMAPILMGKCEQDVAGR